MSRLWLRRLLTVSNPDIPHAGKAETLTSRMPSDCGFLSPQETRGLTAHGSPNSSLMAVRGITTLETLADEDAASGTRVLRRRSPLFCHSFVLARAAKVFWETLESASALDKACAARWTPKSCWTRLFRRAGGLQRRGKVLSQTLEDKTGTQKRQSSVFFGRKSFSSQPLMGLSCVREFSERPHAAPLPHKRDEGVRNQFSGGNRCHPDGPAVRNSSLLHPESAHGQQCTSRQLGQFARDGRRTERFRR